MNMNQKFKKFFTFLLATIMLGSLVLTAIPVGADEPVETIVFAPNEDNFVNGMRIRFETSGTDSYAKIENGKLVLKMKKGDMLWFPDLTIKDTTTTISYDIIANCGNPIPFITSGIEPKGTEKHMYGQAFGNYGKWVCARLKWNDNAGNITVDAEDDTWYVNNGGEGSTTFTNNAILENGETLSTTTTFSMGTSAIRPVTSFQEVGYEPYVHTYADKDNVNPYGSFGICARNDQEISIDKVSASNLNETDSYVEDFENIESYSGPIVNMRVVSSTVEFEDAIAFIDFSFVPHESVSADTKFVVRKNGEPYAEETVGSFTPDGDGVCKYTTHLTDIAYADVLTICLEKNGTVLSKASHEIDYGAQYEEFVTNPPPAQDTDLVYEKYAEDFSESLTLVPGENIVNGKKWIYIKNSSNGSAVIENGTLHFTGSNYDMILFEDLNLDQTPYRFSYDITYLQTPADDIWTEWNSWFGGLHYLSDADADGNRHGFITSVTPNDVYMLQGSFGANGAFTQDDENSAHITFPNIPGNPTQAGDQYYWNGRLGLGTPASIRSFFGVKGYGYSGLGMSAYTVLGNHHVSANFPGGAKGVPSMERRTGAFGFVCGESEVSVIVDNLSVMIKGKKIIVDEETVLIPATGKVDIADLEKDGQKLIYATVDGEAKYAGEIITANRLTQINTLQIQIKTRKMAADGETGLKWTTEISKADYEKLQGDPNIKSVAFGTIVVPTANAGSGVNKANTAKVADIAGTPIAENDNYVFSGALPVGKDARDISYSAVGYVQITMKDGTVIDKYANYVERNHAYALSELVESFSDDRTDNTDTHTNDTTPVTDTTAVTDSEKPTREKKGCKSTVGISGLAMFALLFSSCVIISKKRKI